MISWPGVEGIFLIFAMKNAVNKSLHHLLIIVGVITPLLIVFFILGFSFTTNENIYVTTYDADGKLMINVASFEENMNTICWIRPDYVIRLALSRSTKFMLHPKVKFPENTKNTPQNQNSQPSDRPHPLLKHHCSLHGGYISLQISSLQARSDVIFRE